MVAKFTLPMLNANIRGQAFLPNAEAIVSHEVPFRMANHLVSE